MYDSTASGWSKCSGNVWKMIDGLMDSLRTLSATPSNFDSVSMCVQLFYRESMILSAEEVPA